MPGKDGTGPMGMGAITGRGLGFCAGVNSPGYSRRIGRCCGRGFGVGANSNYNNRTVSKEVLQAQKEWLKAELETIDKQLESI